MQHKATNINLYFQFEFLHCNATLNGAMQFELSDAFLISSVVFIIQKVSPDIKHDNRHGLWSDLQIGKGWAET